MAKKQTAKPAESERVMVSRRLPRALWERVQSHVATITPRTSDTAILELALNEYLERHEQRE